MEIIIALVAVALGAAVYLGRKKPEQTSTTTAVEPAKELTLTVETAAPVVEEAAPKTRKPRAPKAATTTKAKAPAKTTKLKVVKPAAKTARSKKA